MPYAPYSIPVLEGLNQDEQPTSLRPGELVVAENCYRRGSLVGTRPGIQALASGSDYENAVTGGKPIRGAIEYRTAFDEGRRLITIAHHSSGTNIFYDDASQLPSGAADPTINADEDYVYSFDVGNGIMYCAGGPPGKGQVQTEDFWSWTGDVSVAPTKLNLTDKTSGIELFPKFVKVWRNYVMMGGLQQTSGNRNFSNNPATIRYAEFASDPTANASWPDGNTIGFNASRIGMNTENYCTGFGTYQDNQGDFLMLLSNREIAAVTMTNDGNDFRVSDSIATGCVHERAWASLGQDFGDAVYVSEQGVHSVRQSQQFGGKEDTFLSWKIRPFFKSINKAKMHHTIATYYPTAGFVLFAFAVGTSLVPDTIMCLDVKDQGTLTADAARWYGPWKLNGITVNHMDTMRDSSDVTKLYIFSADGKVLELTEAVHRDLASGTYGVKIQTAHDPIDGLITEKVVGDTYVEFATVQGNFNIQQRTLFDFGRVESVGIQVPMPTGSGSLVNVGTIDDAIIGEDFPVVSRKIYTRGRGNTVSHEWTHNGDNESFYVGRVDTQLAGAGESPSGRGA